MRTARVFVYGTLQKGYSGYYDALWLDEGERGTVPGAIYDHGYPVAKFNEDGVIHGTYYTVDLDTALWRSVERMERRAGYNLVVVYGSHGRALAFHYLPKPIGPRIESGDFLAYDAEKSS